MRFSAAVTAAVVILAMVGGAASPVAAQGAEGEAYSGAHVEFETTGSAVSGYAVGGNVLLDNVTVQSASEARNQAGVGVGAGLESTTDFRGAGLEIASKTSASVTVQVDSGAEMRSHDVERGVLQVRANEDDQMVRANLSGDTEARSESDKRVVVTKEDGSEGVLIVVGDGEVVVDQDGGVTAEVKQGGQLVYRQYEGERSDDDEEAERMIEEGTATAEVYVQESAESGEETAAHAVEYGQDTTVEISEQSRDTVEMTVERSQSEGKVVLCTVSNAAFENVEDIQVTVDGSAAAQADSYSAVEQSAREGDEPRYYVAQSSSAEAATDVAIGIDHFSAREVTMSSGDDGGSGGSDDGGSFADGAGFGALGALAALAAALIAARRQ